MTKKLISTLLCLVMMVSVIGVSATSEKVTENNGRVTYTDNFDGNSGKANSNTSNSYSSEAIAYNSNSYAEFSEAGPDGSVAMVFPNYSSTHRLTTIDLEIGSNYSSGTKEYILSYDFKIDSSTISGEQYIYIMTYSGSYSVLFRLNPDFTVSTCTDSNTYNATSMTWAANTWYHVTCVAKQQQMYGWMCDDAGNAVYNLINRNRQTTQALQMFHMESAASAVTKLTVDNVKIVEYTPASLAPSVVPAPAISGSTSVPTETAAVSVTLDQPIDVSSSSATLTAADGEAQTCTITQDNSKALTYTIALPELTELTNYTLDLSGLTNTGGVAAGDAAVYTFTTAQYYTTPDVASSTPANDAADVSRDTYTMSVTFNKTMASAPATVTLTGGETDITAGVSTADDTTYTFTWTDRLASITTYSVSLEEFEDNTGVSPITDSLSFTTENTGIIQIKDDFENVTDTSGYHTYSSTGSISDVTEVLTTGKAYMSGYVESATGYTGDALKLSTGGDNSRNCIGSLQTAAAYTPDSTTVNGETVYERFVMTYRINFEKFADYGTTVHLKDNDAEYTTKGARVQIGVASGSLRFATTLAVIQTADDGKTYIGVNGASENSRKEMQANHWYNVVFVVDGGYETMALIDAEGENKGSLIWSASMTLSSDYYTAGDAMTFYPLSSVRQADTGSNIYNDSQSILIDDFTIWKIKPWSDEHALTVDTEVVENGTITWSANQPIMCKEAMLAVTAATGTPAYNFDVEFEADFAYTDFCTNTVTVTPIYYLSEVTLDYSGLTACSGSTVPEAVTALYEFTTGADAENVVSMVGTATCGTDSVSFTLYSKEALTPAVYVAYYSEGALLGVVRPASSVSLTAGGQASVTASVPDGCDGYDEMKVFVWSTALQPKMRVYTK